MEEEEIASRARGLLGKGSPGRSLISRPTTRLDARAIGVHPSKIPNNFVTMMAASDIDSNQSDTRIGDDSMTTIYSSMPFPPYEYKEFPKWIKLPDGTEKLVESARAELDAFADAPVKLDAATQERNELAEQNSRLQAQLAELTAKLDGGLAPVVLEPAKNTDKIAEALGISKEKK